MKLYEVREPLKPPLITSIHSLEIVFVFGKLEDIAPGVEVDVVDSMLSWCEGREKQKTKSIHLNFGNSKDISPVVKVDVAVLMLSWCGGMEQANNPEA